MPHRYRLRSQLVEEVVAEEVLVRVDDIGLLLDGFHLVIETNPAVA